MHHRLIWTLSLFERFSLIFSSSPHDLKLPPEGLLALDTYVLLNLSALPPFPASSLTLQKEHFTSFELDHVIVIVLTRLQFSSRSFLLSHIASPLKSILMARTNNEFQ